MLDGVFAFVLYDTRDRTYVAARDAIGVNPLYIGWGSDGRRSRLQMRSRFCADKRMHVRSIRFRQQSVGDRHAS
jgi:asparagine synthetase B (glutamine-hydrolysing)